MNYSYNNGSLPNVKTRWYSHCYHTTIGWFRTQNNKWGCIWGHKKVQNWKNPTNGEAPAKQRVVENSITKEAFIEKNSNDFNSNNSNNISNNFYDNLNENNNLFYGTNFIQIRTNLKNRNSLRNKNTNKIQTKTLLKLNSGFKNHAEIARRINSMNLGWTAKIYENMNDKTLKEVNDMYGKFTNFVDLPTPGKKEQFRFKAKSENFNFEKNKNSEDNFYNNFYYSNSYGNNGCK